MDMENRYRFPEDEDADEPEITQEEKREFVQANEEDILRGLLEAADFREDEEEIIPIEVTRGEKVLFRFRIHALSEEEYHKARDKNTKYVKNRQMGVKVPGDVDVARYRSELIYRATVPEDREKIWNNKASWVRLNVATGIDVVGRVLKAGQKDKIIEKLDDLSGYGDDEVLEETAKN